MDYIKFLSEANYKWTLEKTYDEHGSEYFKINISIRGHLYKKDEIYIDKHKYILIKGSDLEKVLEEAYIKIKEVDFFAKREIGGLTSF